MRRYRLIEAPVNVNYLMFIESFFGDEFLMQNDFKEGSCSILCEAEPISRLQSVVNGIKIKDLGDVNSIDAFEGGEFEYNIAYSTLPEGQLLDGIYDLLQGTDANLYVAFVPVDKSYVEHVKRSIEHKLSGYGIRLTKAVGKLPLYGSMQMDLYYGSDERKMLESILEMINHSLFSNGKAYKIFFIYKKGSAAGKILSFLESKMFMIERNAIKIASIVELAEKLKKLECIPFSYSYSSRMISIPNSVKRMHTIKTDIPESVGEVALGYFMGNSVGVTSKQVSISMKSLNLGTVITGLPGTGKTLSAMSVAEQLYKMGVKIVIISPTEEWTAFAQKNKMKIVKLYSSDSREKINFFKCDSQIPIEKFYENLAMLISNASNAGPYRGSMEKALLSAFHKIYSSVHVPDPADVYYKIEDAIIEQHGKRTNVGVKYTKHGENVTAALESLRLMLSRPEFASKEGINFNEFLNGTVFDLSSVSNNMKSFFYALILNQVYSIADSFDAYGDDTLRLMIILEEAQLVFNQEDVSAAVIDLKQRMQDFRKRGIGIILITHNATDININVRRLCQTKLYFRQSPDIVKFAIADLGFADELEGDAFMRLKSLERRVCAISYVDALGEERLPAGPIFIKTLDYELPDNTISTSYEKPESMKVNSTIKIVNADGSNIGKVTGELHYVGEKIAECSSETGILKFEDLIKGGKYKLLLLGEHKRDYKWFEIRAKKNIEIVIK
ncbi:MAG: ATP-binding protein [Candidatus Micrarchaeia archaeon]